MTDRFATLRRGLVGAWCPSLGDSGYLLRDRSGRNNHGTLTNMGGQVAWTASGSGVAIAFDATNDFVSLPTVRYLSAGAQFTACWWERITSSTAAVFPARLRLISATNTWYAIRSKFGGTYDHLAWGEVRGANANRAEVTSIANAVGLWRHFTIVSRAGPGTNDSANWLCYDNGVSVAVQAAGLFGNVAGAVNQIGWDSSNDAPNCFMDDVRIYNRALTLLEIRLLASQRGIGLVPTRHRRARLAAAATTMWLNAGGVWKATTPHIRVGGAWKTATPKIRVSGEWKG